MGHHRTKEFNCSKVSEAENSAVIISHDDDGSVINCEPCCSVPVIRNHFFDKTF